MSVASHLSELERRHQALEREIAIEMAHPCADPLKVTELKRRKLKLKDEMSRIRTKDFSLH